MQRVIGYIRVSTEDQVREGVSLENQREKIALYCRMNDFELIGIEEDQGISAKNLNRPGVKRVLDMAERGEVVGICIYSLSRMFRNTIDALNTATMLDKKGIALHSINEKLDTQSAMGRFFFTLTASLAEMERGILSERVTDAMQAMKKAGKQVGQIPLGRRLSSDGVYLEDDPDEQRFISRVIELRQQGYTYQKIAETVNAEGYRNRNGTEWRFQYIGGIVRANMPKK